MNFFQQKISGLKMRLQCYSYGIKYVSNARFAIPSALMVNGSKKPLHFINKADNEFLYEFTEICLRDCYQLTKLKKQLGPVKSIVDIGANQGLFTIAARQHFAKSSIACYEPNLQLKPVLGANAAVLNASVFYEAAAKEDGKMNLQLGHSDLLTIAKPSDYGETTATALRKIIERAGGKIDIFKMDCEGGEWDLMDDEASWKDIRSVTMEYHLWAKENSTLQQVKDWLSRLGFGIISNNILSDKFGLITAIKK